VGLAGVYMERPGPQEPNPSHPRPRDPTPSRAHLARGRPVLVEELADSLVERLGQRRRLWVGRLGPNIFQGHREGQVPVLRRWEGSGTEGERDWRPSYSRHSAHTQQPRRGLFSRHFAHTH
jgi:hypothetical protein